MWWFLIYNVVVIGLPFYDISSFFLDVAWFLIYLQWLSIYQHVVVLDLINLELERGYRSRPRNTMQVDQEPLGCNQADQ